MRFFAPIAFAPLALAFLAPRQTGSSCATPCMMKLLQAPSSCTKGDYKCLCLDPELGKQSEACMREACTSPEEIAVAVKTSVDLCASFGADIRPLLPAELQGLASGEAPAAGETPAAASSASTPSNASPSASAVGSAASGSAPSAAVFSAGANAPSSARPSSSSTSTAGAGPTALVGSGFVAVAGVGAAVLGLF